MDNKKAIRNIAIYLGIPILLFVIIFMLLSNRQVQTTYKYSDILNYFAEEQVSEYQLDWGSGEMILTITDEGQEKKISYVVPSVTKFDNDVREYIQSYNTNHPDSKMVQDIRRNQLVCEPPAHLAVVWPVDRFLLVHVSPHERQYGRRRQADELWQGQDQEHER